MYIKFEEAGESKSGLTRIWTVKTQTDSELGTIRWYAAWRRYCFYPAYDTVFDAACMNDISAFCLNETKDHE